MRLNKTKKTGVREAQNAENLRKVLSVNAKINSTLDLGELLSLIMKTAAEVMRTETASLMLIDPETQELVFKVALGEKGRELVEKFRLKMGEGIGGYAAQKGEPVIVNDAQNDERFARRFDKATGFVTKAIMCVPMRNNGKIIGVIQAINPLGRPAFTPDDLDLFEAFADQAALAVERARLHGELIKQEKARQELRIAREIQQNFLPDLGACRCPAELAASSLPALEVGGDFYDVVRLDASKTALVIGDVSGKGVPAALYMVRVISEFRFLAPRFPSPAELLKRLNESLAQNTAFGMFVTLLYILLDHEKDTLSYSSAGHHPILYRDGVHMDAIFLEETGGLPLGIAPDGEFGEKTVKTRKGDVFMLYTDGVTEARSRQGEEYGSRRLQEFLSQEGSSAGECSRRLLDHLKQFTLGMPQHDDTTVLTVRVL